VSSRAAAALSGLPPCRWLLRPPAVGCLRLGGVATDPGTGVIPPLGQAAQSCRQAPGSLAGPRPAHTGPTRTRSARRQEERCPRAAPLRRMTESH
jgi:hypothetical protein